MMEIVRVNSREELDYLYDCSALTVIGLHEDSIPAFVDILRENTTVYRERVFIILGKFMNEQYGLTGRNAYKDDLHIVSISLEDFDEEPMVLKRFEYGWRWFDDVVDSNARREQSQKKQGKKIRTGM